jgi:epoxyqueuosine reductase
MNQVTYERLFSGTPVTRAKREGLIRNALIAMTVTKDPDLQAAIEVLTARQEGGVIDATLEQIKRWLRPQTLNR